MSESLLGLWRDARRAAKEGPAGMARRRRERLAEMVAYARTHSPYYKELYRDLPDRVEDPDVLPVTNKKTLMTRFDDWLTDRTVTLADVEEVLADIGRIGEHFRDTYLVATSSGTSGTRGIYLLDDRNLAVAKALGATRTDLRAMLPVFARGMRTATILATGGHYVGVATITRTGGSSGLGRIFSAHLPLPELVRQLNDFRPALVIGYASLLVLLAGEQEAGRLRIRPAMVMPGGETLGPAELERIGTAFGAKVRSTYAATECSFLSSGCAENWHHLNADWIVFEPVDADYRPTPPGELSHTVLLTNLANRVQPYLRYDLGDAILMRPDPCPCGNRLPAVRVQGRSADLLTFPAKDGGSVSLPPLAFATLMDRVPGVELFQIVQTAPDVLRVRLWPAPGAGPEQIWQTVHAEITRLLTDSGLHGVTVERGNEPPEQTPGGKHRPVVPLSAPGDHPRR